MISSALIASFVLTLSLQAPDAKALAEDLTRKNLEQKRFTLTYSLRTEGDPKDSPPAATVEVAVDYPLGKCLITLHLMGGVESGPQELHLFLEGLVLRTWGSDLDPVQIDFEESSKDTRATQTELIRTLLQLVPAADTADLEFLPWLPSVRLGLSRVAPPRASCEFQVGCEPALSGHVGSWLTTLRLLENVQAKDHGDLVEFKLSDGRVIGTERATGFLRSYQSSNADGSVLRLSLEGRQLGRPFPSFNRPTAFKPGTPPREWDRQLGEWNSHILERVITVIAQNPGRLTGDPERAEFLRALSRSAALCADYLERSFLRQNAREQVVKLLKTGLTASELKADASGLSTGYASSYQRGSGAFLSNIWASLDETLFLEMRMRIRGTVKASGTPLEFAVLQALDRESAGALQKHPEPEEIGRIFLEELRRACDN